MMIHWCLLLVKRRPVLERLSLLAVWAQIVSPTIAAICNAIMRSRNPSNTTVKALSPRWSSCQAAKASAKLNLHSGAIVADDAGAERLLAHRQEGNIDHVDAVVGQAARGAGDGQHTIDGLSVKVTMAPITIREFSKPAGGR